MDALDQAQADAERRLARVVAALDHDLGAIRVGAASGALIDGIHVDHAGHRRRLIELASVTIPDPRTIVIQPWDPASLRAIGTAISHSRVGLTPTIDGGVIRLHVPSLTGERRDALVRLVHERVERAHVDLRRVRHETQATIRAGAGSADDTRRAMDRLQHAVDAATADVDRLGAARDAAIRRV
jgi:ribosome recycling factor